MKRLAKISAFLLATVLFFSVFANAIEIRKSSMNVKVMFNGVDLFAGSNEKPVIINDRCLVPEQPLCEKLESTVEEDREGFMGVGYIPPYENIKGGFSVAGGDSYTMLAIDENAIVHGWSDGRTEQGETIDVPAIMYNGQPYVPIRAFIEKCWGGKVEWNEATRTVSVTVKVEEGSKAAKAADNNDANAATTIDAKAVVGVYRHVKYPEPYSLYIYSYDGENVTFAIDSLQMGAGPDGVVGSTPIRISSAGGTASVKNGVCTFQYKDTLHAEGTGMLTFNSDGTVSLEMTDTKVDGGWSISAANGIYQKVDSLPDNYENEIETDSSGYGVITNS
ncbi:MAG: hypothetical protein IJS31_06580 [Oscillospiraceae bacterium]|nr:hypothetical protein [Oscillospiraceae bacterium]